MFCMVAHTSLNMLSHTRCVGDANSSIQQGTIVVMGTKLDGTCARYDSNRRELHTKIDVNGSDEGQRQGCWEGRGIPCSACQHTLASTCCPTQDVLVTPTTLCDMVLSNLDLSPPIKTWLSHRAAVKSVTGVLMGT
jgi:hypothetical protein